MVAAHLSARIVFLLALFAGTFPVQAAQPVVRVQILESTPAIRVTVSGPCVVQAGSSVQKELESLRWQEVRPHPKGIQLGRTTFAGRRLSITPRKSGLIYLNGGKYRGALTVVRIDDKRLQVVNVMSLEEYLKGVVPSEVDHRWPMETLKAQAIIARTFTLLQIADRAGHDYDVTRKWPQLYGGYISERQRAVDAVTSTEGLVLTDGENLLNTYYHTVCGGTTEDGVTVFSKATQKPLKSVRCTYCDHAPHYHWTLKMSAEEAQAALSKAGAKIGTLTGIVVGARNRSGRLTELTFKGTEDTTAFTAIRWRAVVGPNRLRSTRFSVRREGEDWIFEGNGWGHGVGLCQWGAAGLGRRRNTAEQILEYYYPGARVVRWSNL